MGVPQSTGPSLAPFGPLLTILEVLMHLDLKNKTRSMDRRTQSAKNVKRDTKKKQKEV
jgi:hypothetical protein